MIRGAPLYSDLYTDRSLPGGGGGGGGRAHDGIQGCRKSGGCAQGNFAHRSFTPHTFVFHTIVGFPTFVLLLALKLFLNLK